MKSVSFAGKNENITAFNNTLACKECIEKIEKKLVKRYKSERLLFCAGLAIWFAYVEALIFLIFKTVFKNRHWRIKRTIKYYDAK